MEDLGTASSLWITVEDFPAFIITDDKGNEFFDTTEPDTTIGLGADETAEDGARLD